ncbi:redoxin domain-containing protein [Luteolibacter pohnpeiensis]|uniref:Redoxin domain-containing protein n=1 Tax=Luteolibacter pohnpeiensis TaxID=454153 RepID=A0A934VVK1_9BACT|nr:redoxin domain-containing protein [Luteolibacter pohnpeiensis]MBK1881888.1 redoxin domain-containing protein [Luteolibacter pohnpeiensis]
MKLLKLASLLGALALSTLHAAEVGKPAPAFTAKNAKGEEVSLADCKGKIVVLEWFNPDCPFVKKHYDSGNMQKLQSTYTGKDVVWMTINSAAKGNGGYLEGSKFSEVATDKGLKSSQLIVDESGEVGKAYNAKTTPHLFIINKEGTLVYNGAVDSMPTTDTEDIDKADKWFANAMDAVLSGKSVENATNKPYGCGVKY